jgi:hypothetical protein
MSSSHYAIFQELESHTFQELHTSKRLVEIMRAKILDYFIDPIEQIPDADPGGFVDDLQFLIPTEQRFQRDIQKYRDWRC